MRVTSLFVVALLQTSKLVSAAPSLDAVVLSSRTSSHVGSKRPNHPIAPYHPGKSFPGSPARTKYCKVKSHGQEGRDDSDLILKAIDKCNNGGQVVFDKDTKYTVGKAMDLTFLKHIDLGTTCTATLQPKRALTQLFPRYPRHHPIHQRHRLLVEERLLPDLPERDYLLPARRRRCECIRWRNNRRERSGLVRCLRGGHLHPSSDPFRNHWSAWRFHFGFEPSLLAAVVQLGCQ
jgi:hypothetical protein